jgi:hypothetical protein
VGPNLIPIIGSVIGGLGGLLLLVFLVIWWMRRQRRTEEPDVFSKTPDPFHSSFSSASNAQRTFLENDQAPQLAESGPPSMDSHTPPMVQREQSIGSSGLGLLASPRPSHRDDDDVEDEDDDDESQERLTYYTLPSYHGNVMQAAAGSNLSEADVNAISRRLQEVMRNQMVQAGRNPNELVTMPPRELIEHLVEEQLQPRAV